MKTLGDQDLVKALDEGVDMLESEHGVSLMCIDGMHGF